MFSKKYAERCAKNYGWGMQRSARTMRQTQRATQTKGIASSMPTQPKALPPRKTARYRHLFWGCLQEHTEN